VDAGDLPLRPSHRGFGLAAGGKTQQAGGHEEGGTGSGCSSAPLSSAQFTEFHHRSSLPGDVASVRNSARKLSAQWSTSNSRTFSHIFCIRARRSEGLDVAAARIVCESCVLS